MSDQTAVKMFKAQKQTKRFRKNQTVWVIADFANHAIIWHKWQGIGRYVMATIAKFATSENWNANIGNSGFKQIEISQNQFNAITKMFPAKYLLETYGGDNE
jgi:hypothetical protein